MATPAFAKGKKTVNSADNNVSPDTEQVTTKAAEHDLNVYGGNYTDGDKFDGLVTRKVGFDRMIPPHALEVCYEKTTHIIFPAEITYVDLGNENLVAGLADGSCEECAACQVRLQVVQAGNKSVGNHRRWVILQLQREICQRTPVAQYRDDGLSSRDGEAVNRPNDYAQEIYLERLGSESPMLVKLIMNKYI